jgi:hypothetical protein
MYVVLDTYWRAGRDESANTATERRCNVSKQLTKQKTPLVASHLDSLAALGALVLARVVVFARANDQRSK